MEKQIDQLIDKHKDGYQKYTLLCSVKDFKQLQRLLSTKYNIRDDWGNKGLWTHNGTIAEPTRIGTVKFDNFELNVTCPSNYKEDFVINEVDEVSSKFKNSKKI